MENWKGRNVRETAFARSSLDRNVYALAVFLLVRGVCKNKARRSSELPRNRIIIVGLRAIALVIHRCFSPTGVFHSDRHMHTRLFVFLVSVMTSYICGFSFFLAAYVNAMDPHLEILPTGETQTKPIGSSIILTCKPKVDDPQLITDMQWIDPHNRQIDRLK